MRNMSIIFNPKISGIENIKNNIEEIANKKGIKIVPCGKQTELLVSLGGDGTVLKGFKILPSFDIPLLGLNFGKFGFLTIDCKDILKTTEDIIEEKFCISPRMYIEAEYTSNGREHIGRALNEMLIFRKDIRMVEFELTLGSTPFYFRADGIIISTPTGSTAHAFSAGGPIVFPEDKSMVIVAFAPFTATWRNCIYKGTNIQMKASKECDIIIDGQEKLTLPEHKSIKIKPGKDVLKLLVPQGWDFWKTLKEKFSWGKGLT